MSVSRVVRIMLIVLGVLIWIALSVFMVSEWIARGPSFHVMGGLFALLVWLALVILHVVAAREDVVRRAQSHADAKRE